MLQHIELAAYKFEGIEVTLVNPSDRQRCTVYIDLPRGSFDRGSMVRVKLDELIRALVNESTRYLAPPTDEEVKAWRDTLTRIV